MVHILTFKCTLTGQTTSRTNTFYFAPWNSLSQSDQCVLLFTCYYLVRGFKDQRIEELKQIEVVGDDGGGGGQEGLALHHQCVNLHGRHLYHGLTAAAQRGSHLKLWGSKEDQAGMLVFAGECPIYRCEYKIWDSNNK